jgi:hypothetical protein
MRRKAQPVTVGGGTLRKCRNSAAAVSRRDRYAEMARSETRGSSGEEGHEVSLTEITTFKIRKERSRRDRSSVWKYENG